MLEARIHSIETMGLVDGPGIRTVVFLQGCPLRCTYCHNPDSQSMFSKTRMTVDEVVEMALRYKPYYDRSGGGVTFSGGEPFMQGEFLLEAIKRLKAHGISTAIDTSGYGDGRYMDAILREVDLLLLDIKHYSKEGYKETTGKSMTGFYKFLARLDNFHGKIWFRHVMLPTVTDNDESVEALFNQVAHLADKIERFQILPYHKMGMEKYEQMGLDYPLKDLPEMDKLRAKEFEDSLALILAEEKERARSTRKIV